MPGGPAPHSEALPVAGAWRPGPPRLTYRLRPAMLLRPRSTLVTGIAALTLAVTAVAAVEWKSGVNWKEPVVVDPGPPGGPPADALVLFDGKSMDEWSGADKWTIENGYGICGSNVTTRKKFGDCQLHLEFATPEKVSGEGQGRGNSGVYLMGRYEVQILDSHENKTYFDGQCASIYKQHPPLVNVSRRPGEWQAYDIIFHGPRFRPDGSVRTPATVTVLQNGVLVQDHYEILGETFYDRPPIYAAHGERESINLQFHGNPVRFRNIWIRDLLPAAETAATAAPAEPKKS